MHLYCKVLGLYFLPALTDSISSFNKGISHDSSLYVSGFLFLIDKIDLPRLFLEILNHNFLSLRLVDIINPCLWKFIVSWISDIFRLFFLFGFLRRNGLMLFDDHLLRSLWLFLHAFVEIFIIGKSSSKAFRVIKIVFPRAYTWLIRFASLWGVRHGVTLFLVIDALVQTNDGLFQRLIGQFVPKRDNRLQEVINCRRSLRSICRCGDNRLHGPIIAVLVIFIDIPVGLRFPGEGLILLMMIMLILELSLPLIITIINRLFNLYLNIAWLASLSLHIYPKTATPVIDKANIAFLYESRVSEMLNNTEFYHLKSSWFLFSVDIDPFIVLGSCPIYLIFSE